MKKKISVGSILVYLFLSIWAFTTIYPIIWVIQNSFKAKDKILADSFSLPVGDLFTTANYRKAFGNLNIFGAYRNGITVSHSVSGYGSICTGKILFPGKQLPVFHGSVRYDVPGIRHHHPGVLHGDLLGDR